MDPVTVIVSALAAGAVAAAKDVATQAVKDGYAGLKALVVRRFEGKGDVTTALEQVEKKPESTARRDVLTEELKTAGAERDSELLSLAQALLELLKKEGHDTASYSACLFGDGAIAQGKDAVAAGKGGVAVKGNMYSCVNIIDADSSDKDY